jgi:multimeric flavodoxin WrbA
MKANLSPQKDNMTVILEKMVQTDVMAMATPFNFYTMCGQMKTLIDQTCSRYTEINNKEFYFIVTATDEKKFGKVSGFYFMPQSVKTWW